MRVYFKLYEGNMEDIPSGYQEVSCHILFDVNMGMNFRHKYPITEGGLKTKIISFLAYIKVV